ncbi:unnamed protein product, partial [Durusdinium trenchii]
SDLSSVRSSSREIWFCFLVLIQSQGAHWQGVPPLRSASYTFPKPDTKMNAKIDVYQHVGSGSVVIDPKFFTTDEVSIRCHDVLMQNIRLQVTSQVAQASAEEQCQRRQAAQEENKESALTYLTVHGIEQTR